MTKDLKEQAAFGDRKRFEQAVSSTISKVGWKTPTSIIQDAAAKRTTFVSESTAEGRANEFCEGILKMYSGVLTIHRAAIAFCIDEPGRINSAFDMTVKWLTVDYIWERLSNRIPMKSKKQWGLEGQNRSAAKSRYTAQQIEHDIDYELADVLRSESVSSEGRWNETCDSFHEELTAAEEGHDTLYNEKGKSHSAQGTNIQNTIMNVEGKMAPEKRTFFRTQEVRPERPQGLSYGSRRQPKPNPESTKSMEYCKQVNWSQMSDDDATEMLCAPYEEHPAADGQDAHHLNFQCCSCFHRMKNCSRMLIPADDKIRDWKGLTNASSEARKKARFEMQDRAKEAMEEQTWVP